LSEIMLSLILILGYGSTSGYFYSEITWENGISRFEFFFLITEVTRVLYGTSKIPLPTPPIPLLMDILDILDLLIDEFLKLKILLLRI